MRPLPHPHRRAATRRAPHLALLLALPQCGRSPTQTGHDPPPPTVHTDRASPPDHTLAGITEIVAAGAMTCGLTPDAQVLCWGSLAGLDRHFVRPVAIPGVTPAHGPGGDPPHLWAGWDGFYAIAADGHVMTWGDTFPRYRFEHRRGPDGAPMPNIGWLTEPLDPALSPERRIAADPDRVATHPSWGSFNTRPPDQTGGYAQLQSTMSAIPLRMRARERLLVTGDTVCTYDAEQLSCADPYYLGDSLGNNALPLWNEGKTQHWPDLVALVHNAVRETCLLKTDGTVVCLRDHENERVTQPLPWEQVALPAPAVALCGNLGGTAALDDGRVAVWGDRSGGFDEHPRKVVLVDGVTDAVDVIETESFSCALRRGGSVVCWTYRRNHAQPVQPIPGIAHAKQIVAGGYHACVLLTDGAVQCWGANDEAQRGNGEIDTRRLGLGDPGFDTATFVLRPE